MVLKTMKKQSASDGKMVMQKSSNVYSSLPRSLQAMQADMKAFSSIMPMLLLCLMFGRAVAA